MKNLDIKTTKKILRELLFIEKMNTSDGMLDYDQFAEGVLDFMGRLKKDIGMKTKKEETL